MVQGLTRIQANGLVYGVRFALPVARDGGAIVGVRFQRWWARLHPEYTKPFRVRVADDAPVGRFLGVDGDGRPVIISTSRQLVEAYFKFLMGRPLDARLISPILGLVVAIRRRRARMGLSGT